MSMRFPYAQLSVSTPVLTLDGRLVRPQPVITPALVGPLRTVPIPSVLDTGADDVVFPEGEAARAGIDLSGAILRQMRGIGTAVHPVRFLQVTLRLSDGVERREWPAWVGFTPFPLRRGLLGFAGFLRYFDATFRGAAEEVELAANALYPGT
ncbi:MAG: aspartyl protease family protein [Gemmataceae bacterium]